MKDLRDPDVGDVMLYLVIVVGCALLLAASPHGVLAIHPQSMEALCGASSVGCGR